MVERRLLRAGLSWLVIAAMGGCGQSPGPTKVPMHPLTAGAERPGDLDGPPPGAGPDESSFDPPAAGVVADQLIVAVEPGQRALLADGSVGGPVAASGLGRPIREFDLGRRFQIVKIPPGMAREEAIRRLERQPGIRMVAPNRIYGTNLTPSDDRYGEQWAMQGDRIDAESAWESSIDARNVVVAVIDTGVDYNHPELKGRVILGPDLADGDADPMDTHGHGTHVSGIIGAAGNNGQGVAGVAWNCKIMAIRVLGSRGSGNTDTVVEGIKYAADHGARVINLSLGTPDTTVDPVVHEAMAYAHQKGVVIVAAAGNNRGPVGAPANDPFAIAVSSTSSFFAFEWLSFFSNRGSKIDVAAPGGAILSTLPSNGSALGKMYGKLSGTSMACPFVAGEAALILAQHPTWSVEQVRARIRSAVDDKGPVGKDDKFGFGRINLRQALK